MSWFGGGASGDESARSTCASEQGLEMGTGLFSNITESMEYKYNSVIMFSALVLFITFLLSMCTP